MTSAPTLTEADRLRAEISTLRQILEVHERTSYEQARRLEEALDLLAETEERLRLSVESANIGTWDFNPVTGSLRWSVRCKELFGVPPDAEVSYQTFLNHLHPADRERTDKLVQRALAGEEGGHFDIEYRTVSEEGQERWVRATGQAFFAGEGERRRAVRFLGTVLDITEQRSAGEALRISDERFRIVSRATNDAIWDWDLTTNEVWWNEAVSTLFGYEKGDVGSDATWWYEHIHPDDRQRVVDGIHAVIDGGETNWAGEYRYARADDGYLEVFDRGYVIRDSEGKPLRMIGAMQDITDRKRRAAQLRKLADVSAMINSNLATSEILTQVTEAARALINAHQAVTSLTVDRNWSQAINAISLSDKYAQWREYKVPPDGSGIYSVVCETNRPMRMTQEELESHPRWKDFGKERHQHPPMNGWLAAPLIGRDGRNLGLIQLSDKEGGEFTHEDEDVLSQLAQTASSAIENARLYEEVRAANLAKDEFFAALSHELRTPMTSIMGWTQLISADADGETLAEAVQAIRTSASTQARLIDDLLDVSRIITGKFRVEKKPVDLMTIVEEVLSAMTPVAAAKGVSLVARETLGCKISGDPFRLRQVVTNLLSNAIKFTPAGGMITLRLTGEERMALLQVIDTGEGIAPEFLPNLFNRYSQKVSGRHGGLGLGLAIVKHIVEQHGGEISAHSEGEGKGATFSVRIPLLPES